MHFHTLAEDAAGDRLAQESPTLATLRGAAVGGWAATGSRAGRRLVRLGTEPDAPGLRTSGPRHAHLEGFDLHADTAVRAGDERRLERLCRYVLRPPAEAAEVETKAPTPPTVEMQAQPRGPPVGGGYRRPRYHPWAELLRRTFRLDILACDACGGRLRLVATIAEPGLVSQILSHLGLPTEIPQPTPAQPLTWLPGFAPQDD